MTAIERLESLRVEDVMSAMVVQVGATQELHEVARIMHKHHVSLVPVVDEQGRAVGVLSAFDFVARDASPGGVERDVPGADHPFEGTESAADHMTSPIRSVAPDAPLLEAAELMYLRHLHRLLVLDERGRPQGVISTMDIISAVLQAIDEMRSAESLRAS